jgi:hypothetical protein
MGSLNKQEHQEQSLSRRRRRPISANVKHFLGQSQSPSFNALNEDINLDEPSSDTTLSDASSSSTIMESHPPQPEDGESSAAVVVVEAPKIELDTNAYFGDEDCFSMDNYMLSVYMNDESSVHSRGTASTVLSSSTSSSMLSTRRRHRGAYQNRKQAVMQSKNMPSTWVESMQQAVFVPGAGWSAGKGWNLGVSWGNHEWEDRPDTKWSESCDVFDQVPRTRPEF